MAMNKNLTMKMGNCPHRRYIPQLLELVRSGTVDPTAILSHVKSMASAIDAYRNFDLRKPGWVKVRHASGLQGWIARRLLWGW